MTKTSKQKAKKPGKRLTKKRQDAPVPAQEHQKGFDQLLDDAIFGVKKKGG